VLDIEIRIRGVYCRKPGVSRHIPRNTYICTGDLRTGMDATDSLSCPIAGVDINIFELHEFFFQRIRFVRKHA
jgi:hypothetical protein